MHKGTLVVPQDPETVLLRSLYTFFDHPKHTLWLEVLVGTSTTSSTTPSLSLRRIEYFITRYARDHQICYMVDGTPVWVFDTFKRYQSIYRKRNFDLYCRKRSTPICFRGRSTTLCQLNFFRFLIETGMLGPILADSRFTDMELPRKKQKH